MLFLHLPSQAAVLLHILIVFTLLPTHSRWWMVTFVVVVVYLRDVAADDLVAPDVGAPGAGLLMLLLFLVSHNHFYT